MSNTKWERKNPTNAKHMAEQEFLGNLGNILFLFAVLHSAYSIMLSIDLLPAPKQVSAAPWRFTLQCFRYSTSLILGMEYFSICQLPGNPSQYKAV